MMLYFCVPFPTREFNGLETAEIMVLQSLAHPSGLGNIIIIIILIVISI